MSTITGLDGLGDRDGAMWVWELWLWGIAREDVEPLVEGVAGETIDNEDEDDAVEALRIRWATPSAFACLGPRKGERLRALRAVLELAMLRLGPSLVLILSWFGYIIYSAGKYPGGVTVRVKVEFPVAMIQQTKSVEMAPRIT